MLGAAGTYLGSALRYWWPRRGSWVVAERQACPRCGYENDGGQSFCGSCGSKLSLTCERCGATSPPGFRFCGGCGAQLQGAADPQPPREERRLVTVIFADLVGFTSRAERLDPEDVWAMLTSYYAPLREEIESRDGGRESLVHRGARGGRYRALLLDAKSAADEHPRDHRRPARLDPRAGASRPAGCLRRGPGLLGRSARSADPVARPSDTTGSRQATGNAPRPTSSRRQTGPAAAGPRTRRLRSTGKR
jgi:hypothetical protein